MEELRLLIEAIAKLPEMAVWALVVFYGYKVLIAGSIYGVIRFVTQKITEVYKAKNETQAEIERERIPKRYEFNGMVIDNYEVAKAMEMQIHRLIPGEGRMLGMWDVNRLRHAIDARLEEEKNSSGGASGSGFSSLVSAYNQSINR